jgi:uncharacterized protein YegL
MKNSKTVYHFVLDQSGSMSDVRVQTVDLFNAQLKALREVQEAHPEQHFYAALTVFNSEVYHNFGFSPASSMPELRTADYNPNGGTALNDAIGDSVARIQTFFAPELRAKEVSVVVVILTDGMENASRRFSPQAISSMVKELEETGDWSFTILGADFDVHQMANQLSMKDSSAKHYSKQDFFSMQKDLTHSMHHYAKQKSSGLVPSEFLKESKK